MPSCGIIATASPAIASPATASLPPPAYHPQPATPACHRQPPTPACHRQLTTASLPPPACHRQPATASMPPLACHRQPTIASCLAGDDDGNIIRGNTHRLTLSYNERMLTLQTAPDTSSCYANIILKLAAKNATRLCLLRVCTLNVPIVYCDIYTALNKDITA